jgi:hypothetical protein
MVAAGPPVMAAPAARTPAIAGLTGRPGQRPNRPTRRVHPDPTLRHPVPLPSGDVKGRDHTTGRPLARVVAGRPQQLQPQLVGDPGQPLGQPGHVAWVGEDQAQLLSRLPKWFGAPVRR